MWNGRPSRDSSPIVTKYLPPAQSALGHAEPDPLLAVDRADVDAQRRRALRPPPGGSWRPRRPERRVEVRHGLVRLHVDGDRELGARPYRAVAVAAGIERDRGDLDLLRALLGDEARVTGEQAVAELAHDVGRAAVHVEVAVVEHHGAIADVHHGVERVRDEHDRPPVGLELPHAVDAALLERLVADGQHLVDQQHLGIHVDGHREAQPHEHARAVELHLVVHELLELGEAHDVVVYAVRVPFRETEERGVEVDVLAAGELGVEAGAQLQQRRHPPAEADRARRGPQDPGDALQQGRLARAVVADQADRRALLDREGDVAERPEVLRLRAA